MSARTVADVLGRHGDRLTGVAGVVGVAEGEREGRPCILVLVTRAEGIEPGALPSEIEGFPVDIRETGAIRARWS